MPRIIFNLNYLCYNPLPVLSLTVWASALIAFFIPLFLAIYQLKNHKNPIEKRYIKSKYSQEYIFEIIIYFILFSITTPILFKIIVLVLLSMKVYLLYKDHYELNFKYEKKVGEYFKDIVEAYSEKYKTIKKDFVSTVKEVFPNLSVKKYLDEHNFIYFSGNYISEIDKNNLIKFLHKLRKEIPENPLAQKGTHYNERKHDFEIIYEFDDIDKTIKLEITLKNDDGNTSLKNLDEEFSNCFKYEKQFNTDFEEFFLSILESAGKREEVIFKKNLDFILYVMNIFLDKGESDNLELILREIYSFQSKGKEKSFSLNHRHQIFSMWYLIFSSLNSKDEEKWEESCEISSQILLSGLKNCFFSDCVYNLRARLGTIFRDRETSSVFLNSYLKVLSEKIVINSSNNKDGDFVDLCITLLEDVKNDIKEMADNRNNYKLCAGKITLIAILLERKYKEESEEKKNILEKFKKKIFALVDREKFLELMNIKVGITPYECDLIKLENERGILELPTDGYDPVEWIGDFIIAFIKEYGSDFISCNNKLLSNGMLSCLKQAVRKQKENNEFDDNFRKIENILKKQYELISQEIQQTPLSHEKINRFVDNLKEEYPRKARITSCFHEIPYPSSRKGRKNSAFGFYMSTPRDCFVENENSSTLYFQDGLTSLIKGENSRIIKVLKEKTHSKTISLENLVKKKIHKFMDLKESYFITNLLFVSGLDLSYEIFSYKSTSKKGLKVSNLPQDFVRQAWLSKDDDFEFALFVKKNCLRIKYSLIELEGNCFYENNNICKKIYIKFEDWENEKQRPSSKCKKGHIGLKVYLPYPDLEIIDEEGINLFLIEN